MSLDAGMIFASDSRTNAGVDQIARFSKMRVFAREGQRVIVTLSSGNLSITQNAINVLETRGRASDSQLKPVERRFDVRRGAAARRLPARGQDARRPVPRAEQHRRARQLHRRRPGARRAAAAFNVYGEGNFIEATPDTCYFQIGETEVRQADHRSR
jgi:putative proteasome-type protease